ncbi:cellulose biosynthesis cyclic di-GMP-binding regulatory protein BcsB [soil metagenome]
MKNDFNPLLRALFNVSKVTLFLLTLIVLFTAVKKVEAGTPKVYNIQMFEQDQYNKGPVGYTQYFFDMKPYIESFDNPSITINYTNAEVILDRVSFISVYLNDMPISSKYVSAKFPDTASYTVPLPKDKFVPGFNQIKIFTVLRTSDEPCRDLYNNANWLRILKSSFLHLELNLNNSYPLYFYPYPYMDIYMKNPVQANVYLPAKPSNNEVESMLKLVSDWGITSVNGNMVFKVSTDATSYNGKLVRLGESGKMNVDAGGLGDNSGLIRKEGGADREPILSITGKGPEGLAKSVSTLTNSDMVSQMDSTVSIVTKFPADNNLKRKSSKAGLYTLSQLGFPQIVLAGIFNQRKAFIFRRPLNYDISNDTYIKVNFYHSDVMNPRMSILIVYINGIPVGSSALNETNTKGGSFTVKIPDSELEKNEWSIEFSAYHDIGGIKDINCDHWYDDLVWTVVEGNSEIYLAPGNFSAPPSLKNMPFAITDVGLSSDPIVFWLPSKLNDAHLTLAGLLAAKSGQTNKQLVGYRVITSDNIDDSIKKSSTIVMLGYKGDGARWNQLKDKNPLTPSGAGYTVDKNFNTTNNELASSSAILQAAQSPWNTKGVVYSIMVDDDNTVNKINEIITNRDQFAKLNGPLMLLKKDGRLVEVPPVRSVLKQIEKSTNIKLWYFIIGAIVIVLLLLFLFRKKIFR